MSSEYTITANFIVTSEKDAANVISDVYKSLLMIGSNCLIQQVNCNQWVDQTNSTAQVFNDDGTPKITETDVEIVETDVQSN